MRLLLVLIALLLLGGAVLYFKPEFRQRLQEVSSEVGLSGAVPKKTTRLYKWRDAARHWQITDQPPPQGTTYETLEYREDINVLPRPPGLK
jgi:hypothetical protein